MVIARSIVEALRARGDRADIVLTPQNRFGRQAAAYAATWLTDLGVTEGGPIDQVISLRYPSYAVRHPNHVCWLNHTMREYYDLWPRFSGGLSAPGLVKERVRKTLIQAADRYLLTKNVRRLFVLSKTVQDRMRHWPELKSTVLYPPPPPRAYRCDEYGDYVFMVSRLTPLKRADLLLRALAAPDGRGIRAVIAGEGEEQVLQRHPLDVGGMRAQEEGLPPVDGIDAHHRMADGRVLRALRVGEKAGLHLIARPGEAVHRDRPLDLPPQVLRQARVGAARARELRVTALGRHDPPGEERAQ